MATHSKGKM